MRKVALNNVAWFVYELRRWVSGLALWILAVSSAGVTILATFGKVETGAEQIAEGTVDAATLTELSLSMPFGGVLFATFLGIIITGSDFDTKFSNRLLMVSRSSIPMIINKTLVAGLLSTVIGVTTLVSGRFSTQMFFKAKSINYDPQMDIVIWIRGYLLLYMFGAFWGVAVALLFKNALVAMGVQVVYQTTIETVIITSYPDFGKWLFGAAQMSLIEDPSFPERLDFPSAVGISIIWLVAIFIVSFFVLHHSSQPLQGLLNGKGNNKDTEAVLQA